MRLKRSSHIRVLVFRKRVRARDFLAPPALRAALWAYGCRDQEPGRNPEARNGSVGDQPTASARARAAGAPQRSGGNSTEDAPAEAGAQN